MPNLRLIPNTTQTTDSAPGDTTDNTRNPKAKHSNTWPTCCDLDPADEFTDRNPGVLGHKIYRTAAGALEHARHSDTEAVRRSEALLDEQLAALDNFDDHAARHALTGLITGLRNDICLTEADNGPPGQLS